MTNLKTLSVSELHQQIKNATDELIAREISSVDKPEKPEKVEIAKDPKILTVKLKAEIGETILIVNPQSTSGEYDSGDFAKVVGYSFDGLVLVDEWDERLYHDEYEVIIEQPKIKTEKRNAQIGEKVLITNPREGSAGVAGEVFTVSRAHDGQIDVEEIRETINHWAFKPEEYEVLTEEESRTVDAVKAMVNVLQSLDTKSANQQRAETIQRAREFVKDKFFEGYNGVGFVVHGCSGHNKVEFIVNKGKRTVVALLKFAYAKGVPSRGIAKCMLDEVFNADIGKAIALARALEIEIPQEFLNAVQPSEKVVGMIVDVSFGQTRELVDDDNSVILGEKCHIKSDNAKWSTIIDDTNAIYEVAE